MTYAINQQASFSGARVLVVEDESVVALALMHLLDDLGCDVLGPGSGLVSEQRIEAVITSYISPTTIHCR